MVSCAHIPREQASTSTSLNGYSFLLTIRRLLLRQTLESTQYQIGNKMSQISALIDSASSGMLLSERLINTCRLSNLLLKERHYSSHEHFILFGHAF
jgi:hypothetical protein